MAKCPECNGYGQHPPQCPEDGMEWCEYCYGTGEVDDPPRRYPVSSGTKNPKLISKSRLASTDGHTEGPWVWNINMDSKSVELLGRSIVMDFVRWGMDRACPRFMRKLSGDVYILERPHEIPGMIQPIPEREHHFKWRADLNHPDANLIALAAELKEENAMLRQAIVSAVEDIEYRGDPEPPSVWHLADLAHKIKEEA